MSDLDPIMTAQQLTTVGMCAKGQREWWRGHGMDFRDHLKNGTRRSVMAELAKTDALAAKAVEKWTERYG